jgi:hypothetical protein
MKRYVSICPLFAILSYAYYDRLLDDHSKLLNQMHRNPQILPGSSQKVRALDLYRLPPRLTASQAISAERQSLVTAIWMLGTWLYLQCGVSRERASRAMFLVFTIVLQAIRLGQMLGSKIHDPILQTTHDIRTAISALSLEPVLQRTVCCPKCFAPYSLDSLPEICPRRETRRSRLCGESLWMERYTAHGSKKVPRRLYTTQSFVSWLEFFLSRPGIEDLLDASYQSSPLPDVMWDIYDSPAWRSLGPYTTTYGNLTFSYYIDWFNPLTNKIAGKKISCGAIMMFCLNLPPELRHKPENTFFVGLTPPPKEPTVVTITAVSDPIMEQLDKLWAGCTICSYRHPEGIQRRVAVLPLIADVPGIQKVAGYASHGHKHFCWFCNCQRDELDRVDIKAWIPRSPLDIRTAAMQWRDAKTKVARKSIFDQTGVRWSSLHRLIYRDPVRHTVLGVMHNWFEGVLQHHARRFWGIGVDSGHEEEGTTNLNTTSEQLPTSWELISELHDDDLETELASLVSDSQSHVDTPAQPRALRRHATSSLAIIPPIQGGGDSESGDDDYILADDESSDEDDETEPLSSGPCVFDATELEKIHDCMRGVILPTYISRPPTNLGEKTHGKLKADNWFVLFTVFLPMCLPELWSTSSDRDHLLLENFFNLVVCTNILGSFSTTSAMADTYLAHYIRYRQPLKTLFPHDGLRPNHHYAMHNGDFLKFWGPLMAVSEFPYERHNGMFQKVKTNGHMRMFATLQLCIMIDTSYQQLVDR